MVTESEIKKVSDTIYSVLKEQLEEDLGDLWDSHRDSLKDWALTIAKLKAKMILDLSDEEINKTIQYAYAGINSLKARIYFELEETTREILVKVLQTIVSIAIKGSQNRKWDFLI